MISKKCEGKNVLESLLIALLRSYGGLVDITLMSCLVCFCFGK